MAAQLIREFAHAPGGDPQIIQHTFRNSDEFSPGRSDPHLAGCPLEKKDAENVLDPLDGPRQRGL